VCARCGASAAALTRFCVFFRRFRFRSVCAQRGSSDNITAVVLLLQW
jgi:hypothetical protein